MDLGRRPQKTRPLIRLAALALALPVTVHAAPASPYLADLARQCPGQHLENMTAGDLEGLMEDFETRFTPAQTRQLQDAIGERCAKIEAGLSCGNGASLAVFRRFGVLQAFVRQACASGWRCRGFADCAQTKPQR